MWPYCGHFHLRTQLWSLDWIGNELIRLVIVNHIYLQFKVSRLGWEESSTNHLARPSQPHKKIVVGKRHKNSWETTFLSSAVLKSFDKRWDGNNLLYRLSSSTIFWSIKSSNVGPIHHAQMFRPPRGHVVSSGAPPNSCPTLCSRSMWPYIIFDNGLR